MRTFERAAPADAEAVWALFQEAKRTGRENGTTDWDDGYPTREIVEEDIACGALWALREDGRLIAAISLIREDFEDDLDVGWTDAPSCILARLCVDPALQGRGIGADMMLRITREARRQGFRATRHLAALKNPAALHLYRKLGYRELGRVVCFDIDFVAFERLIEAGDGGAEEGERDAHHAES